MLEMVFIMLNSLPFRIILTFFVLMLIRKLFFLGVYTSLKRDMKGKIVIITGSSAGIGKATASQLLNDGADVIFACRDEEKTKRVISSLPKELQKHSHFIKIDLCSFKSIISFVRTFDKQFPTVDILINNAAIFPQHFKITEDGIEETLQSNIMGHIVLTTMLLDKFNNCEAKVLNLASFAHIQSYITKQQIDDMAKDGTFKSIESEFFWNLWMKHHHYSNTKLGNIYFTKHLAEYTQSKYPNIKVVAVNPGLVYTEIARFMYINKVLGSIYNLLFFAYWWISKSALGGAQSTLQCCYLDFNELVSGGYYSDCALKACSNLASSKEIRDSFMKYLSVFFKKSKSLQGHDFLQHELLL
jgi:NAD(P)-dependent dehydrogenase (short-subunit alcohol dehydrogenase family)